MKKTPGDIIIQHKCTKMMIICFTVPEIWHMTDVIVIFNSGQFFPLYYPHPPLQPQKWKYHKNEKISWRYHHFTQLYQKSMIICYTVPETDVIVILRFGLFFTLLPPTPQKMKISKFHFTQAISSFYTIFQSFGLNITHFLAVVAKKWQNFE